MHRISDENIEQLKWSKREVENKLLTSQDQVRKLKIELEDELASDKNKRIEFLAKQKNKYQFENIELKYSIKEKYDPALK